METGIFVGYSRVEEWLRAYRLLNEQCRQFTGLDLTVQAASIDESEHTAGGVEFRHYRDVLSFVTDGAVHYCLLEWGRAEYLDGAEFASGNPSVRERARKGHEVVAEWLRRQTLPVFESVVARPRDLRLLDGSAGFLVYRKATNDFEPLPEPAGEGQASADDNQAGTGQAY